MRTQLKRLPIRAALLFGLAFFLAFVVLGAGIYLTTRDALRSSVHEQLLLVADTKADELRRWVHGERADITALAAMPPVRAWTQILSTKNESQPAFRAAYADMTDSMMTEVQEKPALRELYFLRSPDGLTVVATETEREGEYRGREVYFEQGLRDGYMSRAVVSPGTGRTITLVSVPVRGEDDEPVGVLLAELDLDWMQRVMLGRDSFGAGWQRYLVDRTFRLVTGPGAGTRLRPELWSGAIAMVRKGPSGTGLYRNSRGDLVLGAYRWIDDLDLALLVEVGHADALAQDLAQVSSRQMAIGGALTLIFGISAYLVARWTLRPLDVLRQGARRIAEGNLDTTVPSVGYGEVRALGEAFRGMVERLGQAYEDLEARVNTQTTSLRRRSLQLQAAARVSSAVAAIRDVDDLLAETVHLIPEYFEYDHVGIFLIDDVREHAVLQAASSEGGRRMLARGHKLRLGQGIVGSVAESGQPRIALDVGDDPVYFDNPDLPDTRSEMALPLMVRDLMVGVLDVQTNRPAAFGEEDIAVLRSMADQVALAIENARLLRDSERVLAELQLRYGEQIRDAWMRRLVEGDLAYRYTGVDIQAFTPAPSVTSPNDVEIVVLPNGGRELRAPIPVRGEVIGSVVFRQAPHQVPWDEGDLAFISAACTQIGQVLENARLLDEAQVRAGMEQTTSEMTEKIRASATDVDRVLETTLQELAMALRARGAIRMHALDAWRPVDGSSSQAGSTPSSVGGNGHGSET